MPELTLICGKNDLFKFVHVLFYGLNESELGARSLQVVPWMAGFEVAVSHKEISKKTNPDFQ